MQCPLLHMAQHLPVVAVVELRKVTLAKVVLRKVVLGMAVGEGGRVLVYCKCLCYSSLPFVDSKATRTFLLLMKGNLKNTIGLQDVYQQSRQCAK